MTVRARLPLALVALALATAGCRKSEPIDVDKSVPPDQSAPSAEVTPGEPATGDVVTDPAVGGPDAPAGDTPPPLFPPNGQPSIPGSIAADDARYQEWFKKHGLDLNDPDMLHADPDGDGVTNHDEFVADTDPNDPNSLPGLHKFLRLSAYNEVTVPVVLDAVVGETARIRRVDDPQGAAQSVRVGSVVPGTNLKVEHLEARHDTDKEGKPVDLSQLTLTDTGTNERLVLVKDLPAKSSATHAVIMDAEGKLQVTVREGQTFAWPTEEGVTYKVMELRKDQVIVRKMETGEVVTIPKG